MFSTFQAYLHAAIPNVPWEHWLVMVSAALMIALWSILRRKYSVYGSIVFGLSVMMALYLLDGAVGVRLGGLPVLDPGLHIAEELERYAHPNGELKCFMLFNAAVFVPFGIVVSEFLSSAKKCKPWRCLGLTVLYGFLLSLAMELLQWVFKVGITEVMDVALNTLGTFVGAALALGGRALFKKTSFLYLCNLE